MKLGVNVDHVATLREARKTVEYPSPLTASLIAQYSGADSIVIHLREDRRHIKEKDAFLIKETIDIELNLEMSLNREIVDIACELKPNKATLVPERRQEITTEGGLDLFKEERRIKSALKKLRASGIEVSVFIDPNLSQIRKAKELNLTHIELHTGRYAEAKTKKRRGVEFKRIYQSAKFAHKEGLFVSAGHGLNYENVRRIARINYIQELNIGHSIISKAIFIGLPLAIEEMRRLID
ncbi:MAG: pyridoxine 5'-phosphate synthase [Candidatus Omnitrophica bacterium]|nr:pyridoxine 5'-phosphate synthase [Candidatus Omnitrophota bacterium]